MKAGLIDRIVGAVSPAKGAARMRARLEMQALQAASMHYDGAALGRRTDGWRRVSTDANGATQGSLGRLRDVSSDMMRNNAWARRGREVIVNNVVGRGIIPQVKGTDGKLVERLEALLVEHLDTAAIDAAGSDDLYGLQALALGAIVERGAVLVRRRRRRPEDKLPLPFQLQLLEADYLDSMVDGAAVGGGGYAIQGVEFDALGRRVAYWLFDEHPGGRGYRAMTSRRVPAADVAHVYRKDRPGQVTGVPWLAPIMLRMQDFADFEDARLMREKIAACFAVFEEDAQLDTPSPLGGTQIAGSSAFEGDSIEPGMVARLAPGRSVKFASPPATQGHGEYSRGQYLAMAAGLGITVESLTGDLSGVNFSSGRMGWLEMARNVDGWQQHIMIAQFCRAVERWTFEAAAVSGIAGNVSMVWTPPRREMIDQTKELPAIRDAIRAGLETPSQAIRRFGRDPDEFFEELKSDFARLDDLGLTLDIDPRRVSRAGLTQARPEGSVLPDTQE